VLLLFTHRSDDYKNLYNLVTHEHLRDGLDLTTKYTFAGILLACLKAVGYFKSDSQSEISTDDILIGEF